jgi:uncharacterized membrane protein
VLAAGFGALTLGTFGDYALVQGSFWASNGFGLELVGFLVLVVATPLLGWALRRETGLAVPESIGVAVIGPAGVILGAALVVHIPSGPASWLMLGAIGLGVIGLPSGRSPTEAIL